MITDRQQHQLVTDYLSRLRQEALRRLPADRAAAVAAAHSEGVTVIDVPAEAELGSPVRIRLTGTAHEVVHGHLLVRVGRFARATVVLEHTGTSQYSEVVSVVAGDGAQVMEAAHLRRQ